ncbi:MAG: hypothetical protein EBR30_11085 [Cytophagia bacterium]|nr:hypothetical protein [Cytophagia bacterium]NBW35541.1 hypothetical protein [Cytophagia bacterium]
MSSSVGFFKGRKAVIATKHAKEKVMQPLLHNYLGVDCFTLYEFDTDVFGTFAGEVERRLAPKDTLREKINAAMQISKADLGFGSEGSFGPHPQIPFIPCDIELVMMIDQKHNLEVVASHLTTETNFRQAQVSTIQDLHGFLESVDFPTHSVILKEEKSKEIRKGINNWGDLYQATLALGLGRNVLTIETDMRAMFNPTRMQVIESTTKMLLDKVMQQCPACNMPGYGDEEFVSGLPCSLCGEATDLVKQKIIHCPHCGHHTSHDIKKKASPMYCNHCNP